MLSVIDHLFWMLVGIFILAAVWFGWLAAKKGWGWALAKLHAWWNTAAADVAAIKSDVNSLKSRVTALESKVAPAAEPAAAVQQSPNSPG